eukprot:m.123319 g.123319  ORF g.123319 m.123319 type:complete len:126 (+) comp17278_c2_seq19:6974-7351(+)
MQECSIVCNGHSTDCISAPSSTQPVCSGCAFPTTGEFCHECVQGYFVDPTLQEASFEASGLASSDLQETAEERAMRIQTYVQRIDVEAVCVPCTCNGKRCDGYIITVHVVSIFTLSLVGHCFHRI